MYEELIVKSGITTRLERTVESLFVYRCGRSAAAQPERYAAFICFSL
ncbi:hypothetical protein NIES2104_03580 [Leptolyngbya sp. NIES-2104]|nr:hypothetical protein NIES2104_03580 [Leptolyngbya sp. NIES-2104]